MRSTSAKVLRVFYWIFLLTGTFWSVAVFASIGEQVETDGWGIAIFAAVFLVAFGLLPALLFYLWARHADREKVRPVAAGGGPTAPVPGWPPPGPGVPGTQPPYAGPFQAYPGFQDPVRERRP